MKKVIAINGSPRKQGNTATLLQHALDGAASTGAETKYVHLYDLHYKGCISCFACKLKDGKYFGKCAVNDGLSPLLEEIMKADLLLLGSPIFLHDLTGIMRSFMERAIFMNLSYDTREAYFKHHINVGFIYTMNATKELMEAHNYQCLTRMHEMYQRVFGGKWEHLVANDTYQFHDYSKYAAGSFDLARKEKVRKEEFPVTCKEAYDMGKRLAQ